MIRDVLVRAARSGTTTVSPRPVPRKRWNYWNSGPTPIVVTDLRMPGQGGIWLVGEVRRRWPESAIIVLTAGQDTGAARQCLDAGADHYFVKPVKLDEFHHVLERDATNLDRTPCGSSLPPSPRTGRAQADAASPARFLSAIDSLVRTMEERDPYTAGHSVRVRMYFASPGPCFWTGRPTPATTESGVPIARHRQGRRGRGDLEQA